MVCGHFTLVSAPKGAASAAPGLWYKIRRGVIAIAIILGLLGLAAWIASMFRAKPIVDENNTASVYTPPPPPAEPPAPTTEPLANPPPTLQYAQDLLNESKAPEALACVDEYERLLGPKAKIERWRIDTGPLESVAVGMNHIYLTQATGKESTSGVIKESLATLAAEPGADALPWIVTCVETASGRQLWSRRVMMAQQPWDKSHWLKIDPVTDDALVWGSRIYRLSADAGMDDGGTEAPHESIAPMGIVNQGKFYMPSARTADQQARHTHDIACYDPGNHMIEHFAPRRIFGDAARYQVDTSLTETDGAVTRVVSVDGDNPGHGWQYTHTGDSCNFPVTGGSSLYLLEGMPDGPSEVVRLEAGTGAVRWRFTLPDGAFDSRRVRIDEATACDFNALSVFGDIVLAMGGDGMVYVLDGETGRLRAKVPLPDSPICAPVLCGNLLVTAGRTSVSAYSLDVLCGRLPGGQKSIDLMRARCQAAMENYDQAYVTLTNLLALAPEDASAWGLLAEVCANSGKSEEEITALLRQMVINGLAEVDGNP